MPLRCGAGAFLRLFEKHSFSNSLSIETTLSIEFAAVCARLLGALASGLYKNRDTCSPVFMEIAASRNFLFDARYARRTFSTDCFRLRRAVRQGK